MSPPTGFTELYATHFQRLATQLYAYLGDHAEAQDLTQEAFCRALDHWHRISAYDDPDLLLSPDGAEVWAVGPDGALSRLTGGRWTSQGRLPAEAYPHLIAPLGGGVLLVADPRGVWRLQDGLFTHVPGLPPMEDLRLLSDGTLLGYGGDAIRLSPEAGPAMDQPWVKIT